MLTARPRHFFDRTFAMTKHVSKPQLGNVSSAAALALLQEVANCGGDPQAQLARAQIPSSLADLSSGRIAHISRSHFALLCRECITVLETHASRHGKHPPMQKDEFEMLCYCVVNCKNLHEVILRAASFCRMLGGRAGELALTVDASGARFTMTTFRGRHISSALIADLLGITAYHRLFSWLIGETIECSAIAMTYPELIGAETLFELFHYSVAFDSEHNQFQFAARYLDKPVVRSYQELLELLQFFPFDLITADLSLQRLEEALAVIIKARMLQHEPMPTLAQLASLFNISNATLRRRLEDENTSISAIKERCRHDWALELLEQPRLTLEEIADKLGFSDAGAFRRAFKSWTGATPSHFRSASARSGDRT